MTARDDFVAYLFDHRVGVVQTVQLTLAKLDAALAEAREEAMEVCCKGVCLYCAHPDPALSDVYSTADSWWHAGATPCQASEIRDAWAEQKKNGREAEGGGEGSG